MLIFIHSKIAKSPEALLVKSEQNYYVPKIIVCISNHLSTDNIGSGEVRFRVEHNYRD